MKKTISLFVITLFVFVQLQAQVHYQNTTTNNINSSAIGYGTVASGEKSFASGITSTAEGVGSTTMGIDNLAIGHYSITMGSNLKAQQDHAIVIGSGHSNYFRLTNNNTYSLMIGFLSQYPTLFVSTSPAYNKTGRVGIGNVTSPQAKLHIRADEGEEAAVFIEPNSWRQGAQATLLLGNMNHGIKADEGKGLTFFTENNYYFPDGKVSIGRNDTGEPDAELDINGTVKMTGLRLSGQIIRQGYILTSIDEFGQAQWRDPIDVIQPLWTKTPKGDIYRISKVGIGTEDPQEKLDVNGNLMLNDVIVGKQTYTQTKWNDPSFLTIIGSTNNQAAKIMIPKGFDSGHNALKIINPGVNGGIQFSNEGIINFNIRRDDVLIGRPDHEMEVKVNGKIWSHEVEVKLKDWWDDVFDKNYDLMPLADLETFVKTNQHLPDIPTEQQIIENGVNLGEMNALLLKKVEELTLYVIELKNELETLNKKYVKTKHSKH